MVNRKPLIVGTLIITMLGAGIFLRNSLEEEESISSQVPDRRGNGEERDSKNPRPLPFQVKNAASTDQMISRDIEDPREKENKAAEGDVIDCFVLIKDKLSTSGVPDVDVTLSVGQLTQQGSSNQVGMVEFSVPVSDVSEGDKLFVDAYHPEYEALHTSQTVGNLDNLTIAVYLQLEPLETVPASVYGTVYGDTREVLPGVKVWALNLANASDSTIEHFRSGRERGTNFAAATDGEGQYQLTLPSGVYLIKAVHGTFLAPLIEKIYIGPGESLPQDFYFQGGPSILVTVTDSLTGVAIPNVEVYIWHNVGKWYSDARTDLAGVAEFKNVAKGSYKISVSTDGYRPSGVEKSVSTADLRIDFKLAPDGESVR